MNIIVGFPTETEEDFQETLGLLNEVDFTFAEYQNKFKLKFSAFLRQHSPYIPLSGIFSRLH